MASDQKSGSYSTAWLHVQVHTGQGLRSLLGTGLSRVLQRGSRHEAGPGSGEAWPAELPGLVLLEVGCVRSLSTHHPPPQDSLLPPYTPSLGFISQQGVGGPRPPPAQEPHLPEGTALSLCLSAPQNHYDPVSLSVTQDWPHPVGWLKA